jgi:hypothetical protein
MFKRMLSAFLASLLVGFTAFSASIASAQEAPAPAPKPAIAPSGIILLRGLVPVGPGETPYLRVAAEFATIVGPDAPLNVVFAGLEVPIFHQPHSFLAALELTALVGYIPQAGIGALAFREFAAIKFRQNPGAFLGHMAFIGEQVLALAPDGHVAKAPTWGTGIFNLYQGVVYAGVRASGDFTVDGSGKAGPAIAIKLEPTKWSQLFVLPSVEFSPDGSTVANVVAIGRLGRDHNVQPKLAPATPAQLSGPAPFALLPGQVTLLQNAKDAAEAAQATSLRAAASAEQANTTATTATLQTTATAEVVGGLRNDVRELAAQVANLTTVQLAATKKGTSKKHTARH